MMYWRITFSITYPNPQVGKQTYENVLVATPDGKRFYNPLGGPTYSMQTDYTILEDYGEFSHGSDAAVALTIEYFKAYRQPECKLLGDSAGWLSPEGKFYPCMSWEHDALAEQICLAVLGFEGGVKDLEGLKWLRIYDSGMIVWKGDYDFSVPQIDAIFDLAMASTGDYKSSMLDDFRYATKKREQTQGVVR